MLNIYALWVPLQYVVVLESVNVFFNVFHFLENKTMIKANLNLLKLHLFVTSY